LERLSEVAGILEKNIAAAASAIQDALAHEQRARRRGLLQGIDARIKLVVLFASILTASLTGRIEVLLALYAAATILAALSRLGLAYFTGRVWIFIPLFSGLIALPALFLTPGETIAALGPFTITGEGAHTALLLILRVLASVSWTVLLILSTPWNTVLDALRAFRLPGFIATLLSMSYRYLLLLLRAASELFLARKSRILGPMPFKEELGFVSRSAGFLFLRSLSLAEGVQMAMMSRGYEYSHIDKIHGQDMRRSGSAGSPDSSTISRESEREKEIESHEAAFSLSNVRFIYPDGIPAIDIEHLVIEARACTVLLGPNGSGKTTLLKIFNGLLFPGSGEVKIFGEPLTERKLDNNEFRRSFRGRIGFVFQDPDIQCFSPTVREELAFGPVQRGLEPDEIDRRVFDALEMLGIASIADRYPYRLSGGEKKRVSIASILTLEPDIYLMDEPTANLDPATEGALIDLLADLTKAGKTMIIATQDLLLARHIADRAVVLGPDGSLMAAGPADEILDNREIVERAGLMHGHRVKHRQIASDEKHTHYTEEE
jgi:cobalt/nickel transport system ATP-binding protein